MIYVAAYLIVGMVVAAIVYSRRNRPRETEIGRFMLLLTDPLLIWLPILLWPLWLVLTAMPQKAFVEEKMPAPARAESLVGRSGVVVIPLTPLGRVSIDGVTAMRGRSLAAFRAELRSSYAPRVLAANWW